MTAPASALPGLAVPGTEDWEDGRVEEAEKVRDAPPRAGGSCESRAQRAG